MTEKQYEKLNGNLPKLEKRLNRAVSAFKFIEEKGVWLKSAGIFALVPAFLLMATLPLLAGATLALAGVLTFGTIVAKFIMEDNVDVRREEYQKCYYDVLNYRPEIETAKEKIHSKITIQNKIKKPIKNSLVEKRREAEDNELNK